MDDDAVLQRHPVVFATGVKATRSIGAWTPHLLLPYLLRGCSRYSKSSCSTRDKIGFSASIRSTGSLD